MMGSLKFLSTNKAVSEQEIHAVEEALNVEFPTDYRRFLLLNNGGLPESCIFQIPGRGQSSIVFYGIETGEEQSDFFSAYLAYKDLLPENAFPIGFDPGGNQVCLVAENAQNWGLYFWDHERNNLSPKLEKMYRLANSFSEFLNSLQYEDNEVW